MKNQQPIRILCTFAMLDRGGAETMCMELYRHMDRSKVQFDFVKHTPKKCDYEEEILSLGGKIYEAPRYLVYNELQYRHWWERHLQEHPEHQIIHGHFFTIAPIYFQACKKMGRITIGHSHSTQALREKNLFDFLKGIKQDSLLKSLEEYSDYCFACSTEAGAWLFPHKKVTVLNNAIDTARFTFSKASREQVRAEFGIEDKFVVGHVGRQTPQKNPLFLLEIFAKIHQIDSSARLLQVGRGELEEQMKAKCQELGIADAVIFAGIREDVERLYAAMDVFLFPSLWEGLPVTLVEAQTNGLQCVVSDVISRETDMRAGLYHPIGLSESAEAWAEKVLAFRGSERLTNAPEFTRRAGFDIEDTARKLQEFYLTLSAGKLEEAEKIFA